MNIIIGARGLPKKFNVPHGSQDESNDNNVPRKSWRNENFTDRQEVRDSRKRQGDHEVRSTPITEIA
jgi:hypothetical protein